MDNQLRGFLQIGFFIIIASACSALYLRDASAEFYASICAGAIGFTMIILAIIVGRILK